MSEQEQIARPLTPEEQARHEIEKNLSGRELLGFTYDERSNISGMRLGGKGSSGEITYQFIFAVDTRLGLKEVE